MKVIETLKARLRAHREQASCQRVRTMLASFGIDVSHLSDEELLDRVVAFQQSIPDLRIPTAEAAEKLYQLARHVPPLPDRDPSRAL